jgi:hypothetical protein
MAAPVAKQPAAAVDQLLSPAAAPKRVLGCPPKFAAKCKKGLSTVCIQNDKRGCCVKSICR